MKRIILSIILLCSFCLMKAAIREGSISQTWFQEGEDVTFTVTFISDANISNKPSTDNIQVDGNDLENEIQVSGRYTKKIEYEFKLNNLSVGNHIITIPEAAFSYKSKGFTYNNPAFEATITVAHNNTYFLKTTHNGVDMYLGRGNRYGFRAVLDRWGVGTIVSTAQDGSTTIKFVDGAVRDGILAEYLYAANETDIYTDQISSETIQTWKLNEQQDGSYILESIAYPGRYACVTEGITEWDNISLTTDESKALRWTLEKPADHKARMNKVRESSKQVSIPTGANVRVKKYIEATNEVLVKEVYQGAAGVQFEEYTPLLQPGIYSFKMQAFFRTAAKDKTYNLGDNVDCPPAYIFIEEINAPEGQTHSTAYEAKVYSVFDRDWAMDRTTDGAVSYENKYYPDNMLSAGVAFSQDKYADTITFELTEPKRLRYGLYQIGSLGGNEHWMCWNQNSIELTCYTINDAENYVGNPYLSNRYAQPGDVEILCLEAYASDGSEPVLTLSKDAPDYLKQDAPGGPIYYTVPEGELQPIQIPAGAIYFTANGSNISNLEKELTPIAPVIKDGHYLIKSKNDGRYLSRGGAYGTQAVLLNAGVPVEVKTDGNNLTTFRYEDTDKYLFMTTDYAVFSDQAWDGGVQSQKQWHVVKNAQNEIMMHNIELKHNAFMHNIGEATTQLPDGSLATWEFICLDDEAGSDEFANIKLEGDILPEVIQTELMNANSPLTSIDIRKLNLKEDQKVLISNSVIPNLIIYTNEAIRDHNDVVEGNCSKLVVTDGYKFSATEAFTAASASYSRNMGTSQWGTIVLPFDVPIDVEAQPFDFYQVSEIDGDAIIINKLTGTLAAGTPVLVRRDNALVAEEKPLDIEVNVSTHVTTGESFSSETINGELTPKGTFVKEKIYDGLYISKDKLYPADKKANGVNLNPFRAYFETVQKASAASYRFTISDVEVEVSGLESLADMLNEASYYDLNGRQFNQLQPGMNLVKNKQGRICKVLVK